MSVRVRLAVSYPEVDAIRDRDDGALRARTFDCRVEPVVQAEAVAQDHARRGDLLRRQGTGLVVVGVSPG